MIIDFTISNYRSIKEAQTLSFEAMPDQHLDDYYIVEEGGYRLLKMAMILGANASGKSNVIKALQMFPYLLLEPCDNKTTPIAYNRFALDEACADRDSQMTVNFICDDIRYCYDVSFNNKSVTHELLKAKPFGAKRDHTVYERNTDSSTLVASVKWGEYDGKKYATVSLARDLNVNLLHNRTLFGAYLNSNVSIPWIQAIVDWAHSYMMPMVRTTDQKLYEYTSRLILDKRIRKEDVAELLRKADIGIQDFRLEKESRAIPQQVRELMLKVESLTDDARKHLQEHPFIEDMAVKMIHNGVPMAYQQESNGTQRYYELSSILLNLVQGSHFVAVDELECRLHPDLYEFFILMFLKNSGRSQLAFTTHMREFLADRDFYRDDSVWFAEKNDEGATSIYSLADFDSATLRQVTSRYNAYKSGRLGAVPRLGDTYIDTTTNEGTDGKA